MQYRVSEGSLRVAPYTMTYKHYLPEIPSGTLLVLIVGGGHSTKVWEETPDGRKGWAPLFAESGRDVVIVDWATPLDTLTQKENIALIKTVVEKEARPEQRLVFLGWSMGGPQAFILAADIFPTRTAAVLGYEATGPLNFYNPEHLPSGKIERLPKKLSAEKIERISNSPRFPKEAMERYITEYLVPLPPLLEAIHTKHQALRSQWIESTVKHPESIPPTFLIYGSKAAERPALEMWLRDFQRDVKVEILNVFPHLGMLCRGNDQIAERYLNWLKDRGL